MLFGIRFDRPFVLLALGLGVLLLLSLLRSRAGALRRTSYLELWEKAAAQSPFWERFLSRLPGIRLWLATLSLAFAGLAAAGPWRLGPGGGLFHVVLDRSASMAARNAARGSSFGEAVAEAERFLAGRLPGDRVSLLLWDVELVLALPPTERVEDLRGALRDLAPRPAGNRSEGWKELLSSSTGEVLLLTDGVGENFPSGRLHRFSTKAPPPVSGFVSFRIEETWPKSAFPVGVTVRNFAAAPLSREIVVEREGKEIRRETLVLSPGETSRREFSVERGEGGILRLRLEPADGYALDDALGAVLVPPPRAEIAVLQPGGTVHPFLRAVAEALAEEEGSGIRYVESLASVQPGAVVLADGGEWKIAEEAGFRGMLFGSKVDGLLGPPLRPRAPLLDWSKEHPLTKGLSFDDLLCRNALTPSPAALPLLEADGGPLAFCASWGKNRLFATSFRLIDSNLPSQVGFPLLVRRAFAWLLGRENPPLPWIAAGARLGEPGHEWTAPLSLGPVETPFGPSYANFLDPVESALEPRFPPGWDGEIPEGPGFREELFEPCLVLSLAFLGLRLLAQLLRP